MEPWQVRVGGCDQPHLALTGFRFLDYFEDVRATQPGPEPNCLPPPPNELVACPRTARHWIITSRTAAYHLNHEFMDEYEDPFKMELDRQRPFFDRAALSLSSTIRINERMRALVAAAKPSTDYVGVHIRHGDQRPRAWKWRGAGYVPLSEYVAGVRRVGASAVWAASDMTGEVFDSLGEELGHHVPVMSLSRSQSKDIWRLAPFDQNGYEQKAWEESHVAPVERLKLTSGALIDLALLSGLWMEAGTGPSATVCTYPYVPFLRYCRIAQLTLGQVEHLPSRRHRSRLGQSVWSR